MPSHLSTGDAVWTRTGRPLYLWGLHLREGRLSQASDLVTLLCNGVSNKNLLIFYISLWFRWASSIAVFDACGPWSCTAQTSLDLDHKPVRGTSGKNVGSSKKKGRWFQSWTLGYVWGYGGPWVTPQITRSCCYCCSLRMANRFRFLFLSGFLSGVIRQSRSAS